MRLRIERPKLALYAHAWSKLKLSELIGVALLEADEPLAIEDVIRRLRSIGVERPNLRRSVASAVTGAAELYRDDAGCLRFDPKAGSYWLYRLDRHRPAPAPKEVALPPDDQPLTKAELSGILGSGGAVTNERLAAAVLEVAQASAMTLAEVERYLSELGLDMRRFRLSPRRKLTPRSTLLRVRDDERVELIDPRRMSPTRRALRQAARKAHLALERRRRSDEERAAKLALRERLTARLRAYGAGFRRAIVSMLGFPPDGVRGLVVLDVERLEVRSFRAHELDRARVHVLNYQVVASLYPREVGEALGLDPDEMAMVDLSQAAGSEHADPTTLEAAITRSTGRSARLVSLRDETGLDGEDFVEPLEREAQALLGLFRYGVLHGEIPAPPTSTWRLTHYVRWRPFAESTLAETLAQAGPDSVLEVVLGEAPQWDDPWAEALQARLLEVRWNAITLAIGQQIVVVDLAAVQAVRVAAVHDA